ncbi:MAG: DUF3800 domain-containing protein [Desulfosporosinus sp.]|nr:DUF3800 domain-containing protein [Desulfosporosinus sp.]
MARKKYYMFVDEVKATPPFTVYNFTGVVLQDDVIEGFKQELNDIKDRSIPRLGGSTRNLHYSPLVGKKKEFKTLTLEEEDDLWGGLFDLFEKTNYTILSGIVLDDIYKKLYPNYRVDLEILAFKTLLQNFARFLHNNNGYAEIVIESSNDDEKLREEFFRIKIAGSKYITAEGYNQVFRHLKFESKEMLNEGIQLADLMANPISRLVCKRSQYKNKSFPEHVYENILLDKVYNGTIQQPFEYGIRKIFS